MGNLKSFSYLLLGFLLIPFLAGGQSAESQKVSSETLMNPAETEGSSGTYEKLEIIGSRIKRINVEGASPVFTLDRDDLDRTGFNNVGDVLRETAIATFGGYRENSLSGGAYTGASTTSLRGFGSNRVLVLMDGKRLPTIGGTSSVDLSLIPMAAVERIDILKDGGSAIYGSDAVGGVINVITKKTYHGIGLELGHNFVENPGGNRTDVKVSYGKNFEKGNILGVLQVRSNEGTNSRDYVFARPKRDSFSSMGSPGSWRTKTGAWIAGSSNEACPEDRVIDLGEQGQFCGLDYSRWSQITPEITQYNALISGSYDVTEELLVFARGVYVRRNVESILAPPPDRFNDARSVGGLNTAIPEATAQGWGLSPGEDLFEVRYRLVEEAGPRISDVISDSFGFQTGIQGAFLDTWEWELSGIYGTSDTTNEGVSGFANKEVLFNAAVNDPDSFNPFSPSGSKSKLTAIKGAFYNPLDTIQSSMTTVNLTVTGELPVNFGGRALAMAAGSSLAWQTYEQTSDEITRSGAMWGGGDSSVGKGDRNSQSAYVEFLFPFLENFELLTAGRFDRFSDFGSTLNPKVAFKFKPTNQLLLRASLGTGYRAPALEELYQAQTTNYPFGEDPVTGRSAQFETLEGGNPNLKEEVSQSFNVGAVIEILKGLDLSVDYWISHVENEVTSPDLRDIFAAEKEFGNSYLNDFGIDVKRNSNDQIDTIISPTVNLSKSQVRGMDFRLSYLMPRPLFSDFRLGVILDQSLLFSLIVEPFPGLPREERTGFQGNPQWKNNITLGLSNGVFNFSTVIRSIGKSNADTLSADPSAAGKTKDHTELDLRVQYRASRNGMFSFMVRNVFDTQPPLINDYLSSGYLNTSLYDPFGRTLGLSYTHNF